MLLRQNQAKLVFFVIICCFCCSFLTIFYIVSNHINLSCDCQSSQDHLNLPDIGDDDTAAQSNDGHKLCILVPFRDRFEELLEFAPYIHKFLHNQNVHHKIYVINQVDKYRWDSILASKCSEL